MAKKFKKSKRLDASEALTPEERLTRDANRVYERLLPLTLRNIKLDEEVIDVFSRLAAKGNPLSTICDYLAIPQQVLAEWNQKARVYEREGTPKEHAICYRFMKSVMRAHAAYLSTTMSNQELYPAGEYQKYQWILERRDPKNWGKVTQEDAFEGTATNNDKFL